MAITLYDYARAPSPRRARMFLAEKQVPHETVQIDLATGEHLLPAFQAINPTCTVPALRLEDGTIITENAGIAAYLEAAYPTPALLGRTPVEKGHVAAWISRIEFEGLAAVAEAFRNSVPGMQNRALTGPQNFAQIPELAARGRHRVELFFATLNNRLENRPYIATDNFTAADIAAIVTLDFARAIRQQPAADQTNLARWRSAMAARASYAA